MPLAHFFRTQLCELLSKYPSRSVMQTLVQCAFSHTLVGLSSGPTSFRFPLKEHHMIILSDSIAHIPRRLLSRPPS